MSSIQVSDIEQDGDRHLNVIWTDGRKDRFDVVRLRQECPCASCIDEMTSVPKLKPSDVADNVRPVSIKSVGSYAMTINFSDGHKTGIYTFPYLRKLGKSGAGKPKPH